MDDTFIAMTLNRLTWKDHSLDFDARPRIMGIVNVTPDSFSDGGHFYTQDRAIDHGLRLVDEGADIIDIGGESTRPFADPVSEEEEIRRVAPVIEALARKIRQPISIDTTKSGVAKRALEAGASIINDISGMFLDDEMAPLAASAKVPVILMHMKGSPGTMQLSPSYENIISEIIDFLKNAMDRAVKNGVPKSMIIIDPGIGFGKTISHNLSIIKHLREFKILGAPILMGHSRKSFIQRLLEKNPGQNSSPESGMVETGTQAAGAAAILNGADILRVHDVAGAMATVTLIDAIMKS